MALDPVGRVSATVLSDQPVAVVGFRHRCLNNNLRIRLRPPLKNRVLLLFPGLVGNLSHSQAQLQLSELLNQKFYDLVVVRRLQRMHASQGQLVLEDHRHHGFNAHGPSRRETKIVIKTIRSRRQSLRMRNVRKSTDNVRQQIPLAPHKREKVSRVRLQTNPLAKEAPGCWDSTGSSVTFSQVRPDRVQL